jgi:hypothetical protein
LGTISIFDVVCSLWLMQAWDMGLQVLDGNLTPGSPRLSGVMLALHA